MHRARRAVLAAFILIWSAVAFALADPPAPVAFAAPAGAGLAVAWPVSSGLLLAEVVTGGASASDEYVELTNAGSQPVDLNGLEVAYASSAGSSATRRVGWTTALSLAPGRHLLIANAAGIYASHADATYTAGIAATGGALVLRPTGGTPIDALGWGDATNAFSEGPPAAAPAAGSSIERGPGGPAGNVRDTNDNASDWAINSAPLPENLAAAARPIAGSSPAPSSGTSASPSAPPNPSPKPSLSPTPTPSLSPSPSPSASPRPSALPSASPSSSSTPSGRPSSTPAPSTAPSAPPSPSPSTTPSTTPSTAPRPTPSATATSTPGSSPKPGATPTPTPTLAPTSIADALARGGKVTVAGVVTAGPSLLDGSGRLIVIQDASAAIEVRLPAPGSTAASGLGGRLPAPGTELQVSGTVGRSYGAPRIAASIVAWLGQAAQPGPLRIAAAPGAGLEWRLVVVSGRLDTINRLGLRWRVDLVVGSSRIPIVGLTGSRIAVGRLIPGRRATIVGIVRRAYPSALDQRFAIEPRSLADLAFDQAPAPTPPARGGGPSTGSTHSASGQPGGAPAGPAEPSVDLRDLPSLAGRLVEVSGIVTRLADSIVWLDDGTATGRLMLTGGAAPFLDLVQVGDPLEVRGQVKLDAAGPFLLVTDPDAVRQAGDPGGDPSPSGSAAAGSVEGSIGSDPASPPTRPKQPGFGAIGAGGSSGSGPIGPLQALGLALAGAVLTLALAVPLVRRRARRAQSAASPEGPHARPTLGPS